MPRAYNVLSDVLCSQRLEAREMRFIGYLCLVTMAVLSICSRAEELHLKDGTKISGTLTGVTGDTFRVKTAYGEIQVPRSQVVSITFPESQANSQSSASQNQATPVVDELLQNTTYTNRTAGFQVTVPEGWKMAPELRAQSPDIIAALTSEDGTLFFFVTPEKFAGNLTTYRVLAETQYQSKFKDYERLSESDIQLDGRAGLRLIWHGKAQANDMPMKAVVYILPYDGRMVRLSFLTLEPLFNDALPIFEKLAASYHSISPVKQAAEAPANGVALFGVTSPGGEF